MVATWNDDARVVLIDEMRKRTEMWDSRRERYASTDRKREVFGEIAATINASGVCATQIFTEDDVRTQWKNLKDTFKRKLKKRQADMDAGVEDAEPTWRFWSKMLFIKHECHHETSASINASVNTENPFHEMNAVDTPPHSLESLLSLVEKRISDESSNSVDDNGTSPELGNASTSVSNHNCAFEGPEIQSNHSAHSPEETDGIASQSPLQHRSATALTRLRRKALKRKAMLDMETHALINSVNPKMDYDDEYTWFGRSVASSLRRLSEHAPIVSLTIKKQISDLIYEAELKQLLRLQKVEDA